MASLGEEREMTYMGFRIFSSSSVTWEGLFDVEAAGLRTTFSDGRQPGPRRHHFQEVVMSKEESPQGPHACSSRITGNVLKTSAGSWAGEIPSFFDFVTRLMFHCARDISNASTGKMGFKGQTVPVAPVLLGSRAGTCCYTPLALWWQVYLAFVKQWGTRLCEQLSLIHIWQRLPNVVRWWKLPTFSSS